MTTPTPRPLILAVLSDLHLDRARYAPGTVEADLIVLAGDVCEVGHGSPVRWAQQHFPHQPVLFVPGNHDFYGGRVTQLLERWQQEARHSRVHVLNNATFEIQGVRFLGTPLWSDLAADGPVAQADLLRSATNNIADFSCIFNHQGKSWTVDDMLHQNRRAVAFLETELECDEAVPKVVVTHWAPHRACIDPRFVGNPRNPFFANHLPSLVQRSALWLHGHTHQAVDVDTGLGDGRGRVIGHPRGYPHEVQGASYRPLRLAFHPDTGQTIRLED